MRAMTAIGFYLLLSIALLAAAPTERKEPAKLPVVAEPAGVLDIAGYFTLQGEDAKGNPYAGLVSIMRDGETYYVRWLIQTDSFAGIGIRRGDDFAVSWLVTANQQTVRGVTLYRIEAGKNGPILKGHWLTVPGDGKAHTEMLTWLKAK